MAMVSSDPASRVLRDQPVGRSWLPNWLVIGGRVELPTFRFSVLRMTVQEGP